jgi:hypothetical protein
VLELTQGAQGAELLYRRALALIALGRAREVPELAAQASQSAPDEPGLLSLRALAVAGLAREPLDDRARAVLARLGRGPEPLFQLARQALAAGNVATALRAAQLAGAQGPRERQRALAVQLEAALATRDGAAFDATAQALFATPPQPGFARHAEELAKALLAQLHADPDARWSARLRGALDRALLALPGRRAEELQQRAQLDAARGPVALGEVDVPLRAAVLAPPDRPLPLPEPRSLLALPAPGGPRGWFTDSEGPSLSSRSTP